MKSMLSLTALALALPLAPALAEQPAAWAGSASLAAEAVPGEANDSYRAAFRAVQSERWDEAKELVTKLPEGRMKHIVTAELYLAANSPRVELGPLLSLLADAPDIPQAERLARLAEKRGAQLLPPGPQRKSLRYIPGPQDRRVPERVTHDPAASSVREQIIAEIKKDAPGAAEAILSAHFDTLGSEARTEMEQRVAWSYYIENDDRSALRLAQRAQAGQGEWTLHADWVAGLAAWRQKDCATAAKAFDKVALRSVSGEMRAAGFYWASRADVACGQPQYAQGKLQKAAGYDGTFYGLLAAEALGMKNSLAAVQPNRAQDVARLLKSSPNAASAAALSAIGQDELADEVLQHQARIGPDADHSVLVQLAQQLGLPRTQLFLAHNTPNSYYPQATDRFPLVKWQPKEGWRVDPALAFAHTLQESRFQTRAVSPAGAHGLMQVRPGTADDIARAKGYAISTSQLYDPATNLEFGQSYLEMLSGQSATQGLLPKVAAAYNAGPTPVARWNSEIRDGGDPLLYIESIPYYETREYVAVVLRNYWMYQRLLGSSANSLQDLSQYRWPKFPTARSSGATYAAAPDPGRGAN